MRFWILAFLLFGACAHSTPRNENEAYLHIRLGNSHFNRGDLPRALAEFIKADELNPGDPVIHNNLGLTYFALKQYGKSTDQLLKAIELKPQYTEARNNLSRVYIETGRYAEAGTELQTVLKDLTFTEAEKAWLNLGLLEFKQNRFKEARKDFSQSLKIKRDSCLSYNYYARTGYELHEYEASIPLFERAIQLCKPLQFSESHYFSALNLYHFGDVPRARARLEELIETYPFGEYTERAKLMLKSMEEKP